MYAKHTIEQALEDLRQGKIILVTDDEDRENEGDMICSARFATTENVNFMAKYAKGLICTPMSEAVARRLGLEQMVKVNTDNHQTAFTVSIDHVDTSTGISAAERGYTCRKCVDPAAQPDDFRRPGHVFPAGGAPRRRADPPRPHRSHGRSDAACRPACVRPVLRESCATTAP